MSVDCMRHSGYFAAAIAVASVVSCGCGGAGHSADERDAREAGNQQASRPQRAREPDHGTPEVLQLRVPESESAQVEFSGGAAFDHFGSSVAFDGSWMVVGAPGSDQQGKNAGAAGVFKLVNGSWVQVQSLSPEDLRPHDAFGHSVAVRDGVIAIGVPKRSAVYVFDLVNGRWSPAAVLSPGADAHDVAFGTAVAITSDLIAVGDHGDDSHAEDGGAVYLFRRQAAGWILEHRCVAADPQRHEMLGFSVDIEPDVLVAGAYGNRSHGPYAGGAHVFERDGETWKWTAFLAPANVAPLEEAGSSVAIDGSTVVVGARGNGERAERAGAAHVFARVDSEWEFVDTLYASNAKPGDAFGAAVALRGDTILVGAHFADDAGPGTGAAYVYRQRGDQWVQESTLLASDRTTNSEFGSSVALGEGWLGVGALRGSTRTGDGQEMTASGAVYLFHRSHVAKSR